MSPLFGGTSQSTNPFLSKHQHFNNRNIDTSQNLSSGKGVFETYNLFGTPGRKPANNNDNDDDPLFSMNSGGRKGRK